MSLNAGSETLHPLPDVLSHGLVAVSTFGLLSFCCSTSLFLYLTYRLIAWHLQTRRKEPLNQFLFLIYNLLLADIQQALAFLLNIEALRKNGIFVGTPICFAQGWFISTGDLASSAFISAIAMHTFLSVVKDYRLPSWAFYSWIAFLWFFVYLLAIIGVAMHGKMFYTRASAWCWISDKYGPERLWLHYFWIFVSMFSSILIYAFTYIFLRRKAARRADVSKDVMYHGAQPMMILYPAIYTVCTMPVAAGRIASLAGRDVSLGYFCLAGSMIACNGWLDVLLYSSTRSRIIFSGARAPGLETGLETFAFMGKGHKLGTTTVIEAVGSGGGSSGAISGSSGRNKTRGSPRSDSVENLYGLGRIEVKGEITIDHEEAKMDLWRGRSVREFAGAETDAGADRDRQRKNLKRTRQMRRGEDERAESFQDGAAGARDVDRENVAAGAGVDASHDGRAATSRERTFSDSESSSIKSVEAIEELRDDV